MTPLDRIAALPGRSARIALAALGAGPTPDELYDWYRQQDRARVFGERAAAAVRRVGVESSVRELSAGAVMLVAAWVWLCRDEEHPELPDHELAQCMRHAERDVVHAYLLDRQPTHALLLEQVALEAVRGLEALADDRLLAVLAGEDAGRRVGEFAARIVAAAADAQRVALPMTALYASAVEVAHWMDGVAGAVLPSLSTAELGQARRAAANELRRLLTRRAELH